LPYDNNEKEPNPLYKERMTRLKNFGLFMWDDDEVVHPKESEWFGAYDKYRVVIPLKKHADFKNDVLGLKTLDEANKLWFYHGPGLHMHLDHLYISEYLIPLLLDQTPAPS
jgi:palmitoyl-protein thioesterase